MSRLKQLLGWLSPKKENKVEEISGDDSGDWYYGLDDRNKLKTIRIDKKLDNGRFSGWEGSMLCDNLWFFNSPCIKEEDFKDLEKADREGIIKLNKKLQEYIKNKEETNKSNKEKSEKKLKELLS
ncbi:MAG: hypothetical protein PHW73_15080 [Atribacterota bacterium]|nr:hypothetical protein [Atribacterota bacterium]